MKLIVGLGNPEDKYFRTRHNLGFMVLDALLRKLAPVQKSDWKFAKKFNSLIAKQAGFLLVKPQTFVNASGFAVSQISQYYRLSPAAIWIVHDDLDLKLGQIKIRQGGASAGHRGVESIIAQLGNDQFTRFRLGIGHPGQQSGSNVDQYVLSAFPSKEAHEAKKMVKKAVKLLQIAAKDGLPKAQGLAN